MVDITFIGQLIDSMSLAVEKLKEAQKTENKDYTNKLRTFIFELHKKIEESLKEVG